MLVKKRYVPFFIFSLVTILFSCQNQSSNQTVIIKTNEDVSVNKISSDEKEASKDVSEKSNKVSEKNTKTDSLNSGEDSIVKKNIEEETDFSLKKLIFEESFEKGLDNWITETHDFFCTHRGPYLPNGDITKMSIIWNNQISFRSKKSESKEDDSVIVASNPEFKVPSNSKVPFNILKTKEPIDFSSLKHPRLQIYFKNEVIPSKSVNFMIYFSSKKYLFGGHPISTTQCQFTTKPDDLANRYGSYFVQYGLDDLDNMVTPPFNIEKKGWVKKDFDLSGIEPKAGFLVIAVTINDNITEFDGPMIDAIKIYDDI